MATNKINDGDVISIVAPYAVVSGRIVLLGSNGFGVAIANVASASNAAIATRGTFSFPKASGASTSIAAGGYVYWDNTNNKVTVSATSNTKVGIATVAATNNDTTVTTRLNGSF